MLLCQITQVNIFKKKIIAAVGKMRLAGKVLRDHGGLRMGAGGGEVAGVVDVVSGEAIAGCDRSTVSRDDARRAAADSVGK